jgi:uncharacterized protein (DUF1800 family)
MPCYRSRVDARWRATFTGASRRLAAAGVALLLSGFACACWAQATMAPVFRFVNLRDNTHFFTISAAERDYVIATYPTVFVYEGAVFSASTTPAPGLAPVSRFWNDQTNEHFYTISPDEVAFVQSHFPQYILEGTAYYAPLADGTDGRMPLYRFWNQVNGEHFYTASVVERDHIIATYPEFAYEGLVYYVYSVPTPPPAGGGTPTVALTASATTVPVLPGQITLTATAADSGGNIVSVTFYQGTTPLTVLTTPPYNYTVNLAAAGTYTYSAVVSDDKGKSSTSAAVTVQAGIAPNSPTVVLTSSATTIAAPGPVVLTANAAETGGTIALVTLYQNGVKLIDLTTAPYVYTVTLANVGNYTFTAQATDTKGATATSATLTVQVGTGPSAPTIALAASATTIAAPGPVILTANAAETGGTITLVTLYQNGVKLVDLTTAPYVYTVTLANPGGYTFTAQATDAKGATATSSAVSVQVNGGPPPPPSAAADIYRLLNQATFGFTLAEAARVNSMGISAWIDDQFTQPISGYPDANYTVLQLATSANCTNQDPVTHKGLPAADPRNICYRDNLTPTRVQRDFYTNAMSKSDQLRQRVAWALSQIAVISTVNQDLSIAYPMTRYQNILFGQAFGNFETLLNQITLSPSMGYWLTMVNNDKGSANRQPNQNYAREIMQLFSIGLIELNQDGSQILDAQNNPVPTYDQNTIAQFANVFTGWTYPKPGVATTTKNPANYEVPMVTYLNGHETAAKTLLPGPDQNIAANQTAQLDITDAIHNIFMHPNVGPFIGKQLIQHLVTSNPSPAYVSRVAGMFNDNGAGVRGDMKAVVKAVLIDPEARGAAVADTFGQLREPALMITALLRGLGAPTDGAGISVRSGTLGEPIYSSPTVFNYYPIDYTIPNSTLAGPEFGNHNSYTAVQRQNQVYSLVYQGIAADPTVPGAIGTFISTKPYEAQAASDPTGLVNTLNQTLMNGTLPANAAQIIVNSISQVPATNAVERVRMAIYQMASSFHFQVQH